MNAWSHLPNARHIDWVLESLKADPKKWTAAWDAALDRAWDAALDRAWDAARDANRTAAYDAARNATDDATRNAARVAARDAAWIAAWVAARDAAWDSILALVAYDDCDEYLSMSYEKLLAWAMLSEKPQAVLLLPLKWIQEHECLVTLA